MFVEYPKWLYHRNLAPRIVNGPEEEAALGPEWAQSPAAFDGVPEPTPPAHRATALEPAERPTARRRVNRP